MTNLFTCTKCNKNFDRKFNLETHLNKKHDCSKNNIKKTEINKDFQNFPKTFQNFPTENNLSNILSNSKNNIFSCYFCFKEYSTKGNLTKHLKNCKIKINNENEKENIFKLLLEKDKQYKEEINELKKQNKFVMKQNEQLIKKIDLLINNKDNLMSTQITNNNNISNSNNINSNNTNTQNNIVMVNFGNEDLSIIDKKLFMDRIVKKQITGVKIPDEILKIIHFNPEYPQLSNIYISDINREKCMIYEGGEWKLTPSDKIPEIIDKVVSFSNEAETELREQFPNNKRLNDRLDVIKKYNDMNDNEYLQELRDLFADDLVDNTDIIKRCEDFQKFTYDTFKTTLYNEGKKIKNKIK